MGLLQTYLLLYNAASALAWAHILAATITTIWSAHANGDVADWGTTAAAVWRAVGDEVRVVQTVAALEIVHAVLGIVRSPVVNAVMQAAARMWLLWAITPHWPASHGQIGCVLMVLSWSLAEVPRYTFYAFNVIGRVPSSIVYLRYTLFLVLYPAGFTGEVMTMLSTLPAMKASGLAIRLPSPFTVDIPYYVMAFALAVLYAPGLFIMYAHMLRQRRRALGKDAKPKSS
ncbi:hypothetical protein PINS_up010585 [Pythium insidiosum]|nr:hypothetical protein PINS_up010585 [Pythium insidiosum]